MVNWCLKSLNTAYLTTLLHYSFRSQKEEDILLVAIIGVILPPHFYNPLSLENLGSIKYKFMNKTQIQEYYYQLSEDTQLCLYVDKDEWKDSFIAIQRYDIVYILRGESVYRADESPVRSVIANLKTKEDFEISNLTKIQSNKVNPDFKKLIKNFIDKKNESI